MDLARPNAKPSSGLVLVCQKPEAAISIDLARHPLGLLLVGQKPEERSPYLSLAIPTARQTPGMPAIGQKNEARAEPGDYQTAVGPEGGQIVFKDFAR